MAERRSCKTFNRQNIKKYHSTSGKHAKLYGPTMYLNLGIHLARYDISEKLTKNLAIQDLRLNLQHVGPLMGCPQSLNQCHVSTLRNGHIACPLAIHVRCCLWEM